MQGELLEAVNNEKRKEIIALVATMGKVEIDTIFNVLCETKKEKVACMHIHLPKLDDFDIINWRKKKETVSKGEKFDDVVSTIDYISDIDLNED